VHRLVYWILLAALSLVACQNRPAGDDDDSAHSDDDDSAHSDDDDSAHSDDDDSAHSDDDDSAGGDNTKAGGDFRWYFSLHAGEVHYNLTETSAAFEQILALGGSGVRIDIFWYDVEPQRNQWDQTMIEYYDAMITLALDMGIEPMIIISNAPDWAVDLYASDPSALWLEYEEYAQWVVDLVGDRVTHYQLWNEPNHLIDPFDADDDPQLFSRAGAIFRASDPDCVLYVNAMANLLGWEDAVTSWLSGAGEYIDVIGVDHYAGTWSTAPFDDWGPVDTLLTRINSPGDPWFGKQGAMLEAGYSSWALSLADEIDQRDWINAALPALLAKLEAATASGQQSIWIGNYYQLIDVDTDGSSFPPVLPPEEAHFGILHSDLSPKVGWDALQSQLATFSDL
jgi:hypothetical protein